MRRHNLDAIRNVKLLMGSDNTIDLNRNRGSQNQYNDVLVTIYDACILFLESIYHSNSYPDVKEHILKELVDSIANRHYNLRSECKDYERLYHIYELVYGNYKYASFDDVKYAVNTLNAVMHFYMGECKVSDLEFACRYYDIPYDENKLVDPIYYRRYLCELLGIYEIKLPELC